MTFFYFFAIQMHEQPKLTLLSKGQGHPKVMIYTNFVELHCLMLHAKFQNHRPCFGEEDFKGFCYLKPWRPSWSCDLDHLYKLLFPLPKNATHKV